MAQVTEFGITRCPKCKTEISQDDLETATVYECEGCGEEHDSQSEAEECCPDEDPEIEEEELKED